jgi:hypothetical protein
MTLIEYDAIIELAAARAFEATLALYRSEHVLNYTSLQKAACIAASVRELKKPQKGKEGPESPSPSG